MANICLYTTIVIVVSVSVNCERRVFQHYINNFQKAVPHNWNNDQEEFNRNLVKNTGKSWGKVRLGPQLPPLRHDSPNQGINQNVLSDKEEIQSRIQQLQNKLMPQYNIPKRTINQPYLKPDIEVKVHENKREATKVEDYVRQKRSVMINPVIQPEVVLQPHIQPAVIQENEVKNERPSLNLHIYNPNIYYPGVIESLSNLSDHYQEKEETEKRDKRQIIFMIKEQPLQFGKKPRTTPNPFIRETNIADYDIGKAELDNPEIDVVNTVVDTDSYQLNEEASEFSNVLSNFYLTSNPKYWPKIAQFADNVLKPLSELLGAKIEKQNLDCKTSIVSHDTYDMTLEGMVINKRVKRKLSKTLIRKRAKKRKQKQRRVERKRLRMLTHARRVRKQQKYKQARLQRHYARMNLTTTMLPEHQRSNQKVNGTIIQDLEVTNKDNSLEDVSENSSYYTESDSENYNTESDSDESSEEEEESEISGDDGNDEYEDYDEESSSNSGEYVDYENVPDETGKAKENTVKKETKKTLETNKKRNIKSGNNGKGKKS